MTAPTSGPTGEADIIRRRRWAYSLISRAAQTPPYGSANWHSLPEGSAERIAAVVIAAEAWAMDAEDISTRLAAELDSAYAAHKRAEDAAYAERAAAGRAAAPKPGGKSFVERRAAQLAEVASRAGDYAGRSRS
jgi:hypothetical protein